ncbi:MAG: hypothetical protein AVDCRST_MAG18-2971, partial [uncultured Thermomicrobiales bacterium]
VGYPPAAARWLQRLLPGAASRDGCARPCEQRGLPPLSGAGRDPAFVGAGLRYSPPVRAWRPVHRPPPRDRLSTPRRGGRSPPGRDLGRRDDRRARPARVRYRAARSARRGARARRRPARTGCRAARRPHRPRTHALGVGRCGGWSPAPDTDRAARGFPRDAGAGL